MPNPAPRQVAESLFCVAQPSTGAASRTAKRVFEVTMRADVAAPLLEWSRRGLDFSYVYARGAPPQVTTQQLTMRWVRDGRLLAAKLARGLWGERPGKCFWE